MNELWEDVFEGLEDPRAPNARRHDLHDILVIAFCTMLCGGQTCTDMGFSATPRGSSCKGSWKTVITFIWETRSFQLRGFHAEVCPRVGEASPWTGRSSQRGARPCTWSGGAAPFGGQEVLGQLAVDSRIFGAPIAAVPEGQGGHCRRHPSLPEAHCPGRWWSREQQLKGNQTSLYDDVTFLDQRQWPRTSHGPTRISGLATGHDWPGLKAVGKVTANRYRKPPDPLPAQ